MTTTTKTENELHFDSIAKFSADTPMEIRFHSRQGNSYYQLLVHPTNGVVHYTLHRNPRGGCADSLTNLVGRDGTSVTLPMKAYRGWQHDVLAWIISLSTGKENTIYIVDDVLQDLDEAQRK